MTKPSRTILAGVSRLMVALTLSLLTGSIAMADPPGDRGQGHGDRHEWRHEHHDRGEHRGWRHHHDEDCDDDCDSERFDSGEYQRPHGYYVREWHRGDRLPIGFRTSVYVVPDVAVYHLRPPPPGYYWVRVDNNAVLAAVATGVVVDVALNLFH